MFSKVFHEKSAQTDFSKEMGVSNAKGLKHLNTVLGIREKMYRRGKGQTSGTDFLTSPCFPDLPFFEAQDGFNGNFTSKTL